MSNETVKKARPSGCLITIFVLVILGWIGVSCKPSMPDAKFSESNGLETCKYMVNANVSGQMAVQTSVLMGDTYKAVIITSNNVPWTCRLIWTSGDWKKDVLGPGR